VDGQEALDKVLACMFQLEGAVGDLWEKRIAVMGSETCLRPLLIQLQSVHHAGGEFDSFGKASILFYF
jgi:hypothetical protein